jgi:hypothetical protein
MHTYVDAPGDGVDDLGRVSAGLVGGVVAEEHGVVVVAAELAEHEQGVAQVALAVCPNEMVAAISREIIRKRVSVSVLVLVSGWMMHPSD